MTAPSTASLMGSMEIEVRPVSCRDCGTEFRVRALLMGGRPVLGTSVLCQACADEEAPAPTLASHFGLDAVGSALHEAGAPVHKLGHMTLGLWDESHDRPVAEARRFVALVASGPRGGAGRGLYLHGDPGNGKSSLAVACMRELVDAGVLPHQMMFVVTRALLRRLGGGYGDAASERLISRAKGVRLLVLDELGKEPPTENSISQLSEILDYRAGGTIVTSNLSLAELGERYSDREGMESLISRLSEYRTLAFNGPDRRGRGTR